MHSASYAHKSNVVSPAYARRCSVRRLGRGHCAVHCLQQQQQQRQQESTSASQQQPKQAVLCTKFQAHDASVTALSVLKDEPGLKQIVTASLDKSLAVWTIEGCGLDAPKLQCTRLEVAGGPVFSLHRGIKTKVTDANVKPREPVLFCGLAAKEITALRPDTLTFSEQMRMNGHTGWVRSLASSGKYLFSCGCNHLRQWDQAFAVPKEVRCTSLFTGDILALAATDKAVFTAGADGSLRCWSLGKLGELTEAAVREKAHDGRITALAVSGSLLFSAGYDGHIKAWDVPSLKLVMEVKGAHGGERVRALVMGPSSRSPNSTPSSSPGSSNSSSPITTPAPSPPPSPSPPASLASTDDGKPCIEAQQEQPAAAAAHAAPAVSAPARPPSPSYGVAVLYSGGDDGLVRRWDARLLTPAGDPLQVHHAAVKALAVGEKEVLVSGDAAGEVAVWLL